MVLWKPTRPILMTADPIGGVWSYALELCRELGNAEIKVALATMGRPLRAKERAQVLELSSVELFESAYKLEWMAEPWEQVDAAGQWLLELQSRIQPSLVHLNGYSHGALRWNVPCLVVGHSCVYSWFEAVKGVPPGKEWDNYKHRVTTGLRGADRVTAPSRFMLAALRRHYGYFDAAEPIYNGRKAVDHPPLEKEPFVFTAGRLWDEAKNVSILSQVAPRLTWPIYAAGQSETPDGKQVHLSGLNLLGQLDSRALASWFGRASIFVLPARYEPFGLSVLEAALAGCALVLGDVPSLRELWRDSALFVSPGNAAEIAAAVMKLIDDASLRGDLSQRARSLACSYSAERMAQGYMSLYEQLLSAQSQIIGNEFGTGRTES